VLRTQEGNWNNQGYGNLDANENMKSIVVNGALQFSCFLVIIGSLCHVISLFSFGSYARCKILHCSAIQISSVGFLLEKDIYHSLARERFYHPVVLGNEEINIEIITHHVCDSCAVMGSVHLTLP
jgi:hypothetical protein